MRLNAQKQYMDSTWFRSRFYQTTEFLW